MKKYFDILRNCPLFAGINADELAAMLSCIGAKTAEYQKGQTVFFTGDPAQYMGVVLTGTVSVVREDYFGSRSILARICSGEMFAEAFACAGVKALPVSVVADEKSDILLLDCARVINTCSNACAFHNRLIQNLLGVMAAKNIMLNRKTELMGKRTTKDKLLAYLAGEAARSGAVEFTIPFDRQELADYLGVERSAMSAKLSELRRDGVIDFRKNRFILLRDDETTK